MNERNCAKFNIQLAAVKSQAHDLANELEELRALVVSKKVDLSRAKQLIPRLNQLKLSLREIVLLYFDSIMDDDRSFYSSSNCYSYNDRLVQVVDVKKSYYGQVERLHLMYLDDPRDKMSNQPAVYHKFSLAAGNIYPKLRGQLLRRLYVRPPIEPEDGKIYLFDGQEVICKGKGVELMTWLDVVIFKDVKTGKEFNLQKWQLELLKQLPADNE